MYHLVFILQLSILAQKINVEMFKLIQYVLEIILRRKNGSPMRDNNNNIIKQ